MTNDNGGSDIAHIIPGIKKNIRMGSIYKGRKKYKKKQHKGIR